jgi:hypothetical protein
MKLDAKAQKRYDAIKKIVDDWQYAKIEGVTIDGTTASMALNVLDKVNDTNKAKLLAMPIKQMVGVMWSVVGKKSENFDKTLVENMEQDMNISEKDDKIAKMQDLVNKLKDAKHDAYEKMMKEKEKHGSSDKWFHNDIVSYRKLHDAHHDANAAWDKAYEKLQKMKKDAAKKSESVTNLTKQLMSVVEEMEYDGEEEIEEMEDEDEIEESVKGNARRKAAAKRLLDNRVDKLTREVQKLRAAKKHESDDAAYERMEKRINGLLDKIRRAKEDFKKKWPVQEDLDDNGTLEQDGIGEDPVLEIDGDTETEDLTPEEGEDMVDLSDEEEITEEEEDEVEDEEHSMLKKETDK